MTYVQSGDTRLAWQQMGEGPDVLLVHGLATNRAFWYGTLAQALRGRYRVTLFDLRGHGYSSRPPSGYSAVDMADDIDALVAQLALAPVAIVGHSYGGSVALEYALRAPEMLSGLVLMDARINSLQPTQWLADSPHLTDFEREMAQADGRDWDAEPQVGLTFLEAMARLRVAGYEPRARDAVTPFSEGRGGLSIAKAFCRLLDETDARASFLTPGSPRKAIAGLRLPVQLLYGDHSRNLPSGEALAQCLPAARLIRLRDAGHFFPLSHAEEVAALVGSFLDTLSSETAA